jgi:Domain of unknown function (DUF4271)
MEGTLRFHDSFGAGWVAIVLLLLLAMLAWVNTSRSKVWRVLGEAVLRARMGKQTLREDVDLKDRAVWVLLASTVLSLSLFLAQLHAARTGQAIAPNDFLAWSAGTAAGLVLHVLFLYGLGWLFRQAERVGEYLYSVIFLHVATGLCILPLAGAIAWNVPLRPGLLVVGVAVVVILLGMRWTKGVLIGLGSGMRLRWIVLYLCAAEVLPIAFLVKSLAAPVPLPAV